MQFIYLIQSQEFFKIGVAQDVRNRLASLQTGNPNELVVISCWEFPNAEIVERCVHQRFDGVRKRGERKASGISRRCTRMDGTWKRQATASTRIGIGRGDAAKFPTENMPTAERSSTCRYPLTR